MNTIQIKRGDNIPEDNVLKENELGYIKNKNQLCIGVKENGNIKSKIIDPALFIFNINKNSDKSFEFNSTFEQIKENYDMGKIILCKYQDYYYQWQEPIQLLLSCATNSFIKFSGVSQIEQGCFTIIDLIIKKSNYITTNSLDIPIPTKGDAGKVLSVNENGYFTLT